MLWLYACMYIVFFGAEVNALLFNNKLFEKYKEEKSQTGRKGQRPMICFKNEHKSDQETYVALTKPFSPRSPVRAALNYILAALLLAFGIYNLTAGETAWGHRDDRLRPAADCADAASIRG